MTTFAATNTFASGATIVAADVNQNFTDAASVINGNIDDGNIAAAAGIGVLKLAAPYSVNRFGWNGPPTAFTVPVSAADPTGRVYKHRLILPRGRPHAIVAIDIWSQAVALAGQVITVTTYVESTIVGGVGRSVAAGNTHYTLPTTAGSADVFAAPLLPVSDNDEVIIIVSADAGTPTVTALCVTITMKAMHSA